MVVKCRLVLKIHAHLLEVNRLNRQKSRNNVYTSQKHIFAWTFFPSLFFFFIPFTEKCFFGVVQELGRGGGDLFFLMSAGKASTKHRSPSAGCNVSSRFDSQMAGASYYHWCSSSAAGFCCLSVRLYLFSYVSHVSFSAIFFFRLLDTLFFRPKLDIVLPAYVQGCNDWP